MHVVDKFVALLFGRMKGAGATASQAGAPDSNEPESVDPLKQEYNKGRRDGERGHHSHLYSQRPSVPEGEHERAGAYCDGYRDGLLKSAYDQGKHDGRCGSGNGFLDLGLAGIAGAAHRDDISECAEEYCRGYRDGAEERLEEQLDKDRGRRGGW